MTLADRLRRALGLPFSVHTARLALKFDARGASGSTGMDASSNPPDVDGGQVAAADREQAAAWLEALEAGLLNPPRDVRDPQGWDDYWKNQIAVGAMDQGFADMMSSDPGLPELLARRSAKKILCAGNGLSNEALALALLGFHVTALDISVVPAQVLVRTFRSPNHPVNAIPGFVIGDDSTVTFAQAGQIDAELCPLMHRSADHAPRGGGALSFCNR